MDMLFQVGFGIVGVLLLSWGLGAMKSGKKSGGWILLTVVGLIMTAVGLSWILILVLNLIGLLIGLGFLALVGWVIFKVFKDDRRYH